MKNSLRLSLLLVGCGFGAAIGRADDVTDWNAILHDTLRAAGANGINATRPAAIVQAAVFDALNGVERRYTSLHVTPDAAPGASRRAAVVQAAYATLVQLFPLQATGLGTRRAESLAAIASEDAAEDSTSIARGIAWGQTVANAILAWRSTDGFTPAWAPFVGGNLAGQWRPTPPALAPMSLPQLGFITTWIVTSPLQFAPPGAPALTSPRYTADFNEVKAIGSLASATRTAEQTLIARFWASGSSPNFYWNTLAVRLGAQRHTTMSENARLLALINLAIADAGITVWRAKYDLATWRPITAIALAAADGNPDTTAEAGWTPLLTTPPYPDYPSGLCGTSAAGVAMLAAYFGEDVSFDVVSDAAAMAGVTRHFDNFAAAAGEMVDARVYSGIHFRAADEEAVLLGTAIGNYAMSHACQPLNGAKTGQLRK